MLISITGPSGVGKGYFQGKIKSAYPVLSELVWLTSRPLRKDELGSVSPNRRSVTELELSALRAEGRLAYEQELYGHRYALSHDELVRTRSAHCLTEFHIDTLRAVRPLVPDVFAVALVPASSAVIRRNLLTFRGADLSEETQRRINAAEAEAAHIRGRASEFSLVVEVSDGPSERQESLVISHVGRSLNL